MPAHFTQLDLAVLVIYFLLVMGTGFYFVRKSRSVEGFTAAGRSLPGWVVGFSILATYVSSISFLANPGKSYATNWNPFVFGLSMPIATWIAVRYFLPYYRAGNEVSAYSHLEKRFGPWARIYVGFLYLLTQLARIGIVMYLMALPLSVLLDWPIEWIIIITGVSVTLYTFMGGLVAVIWTDAIQCIILMGGALLCLIVMLVELPGGASQVVEVAMQHDKFSLGSFGLSLTEPTFWVTLFYGVVINLNNFGIDQNYVQRYIASKSDHEARKSLWLGGMLFIPLSAVFFLIGTTLFVYYQVLGTPADLPGKADQVFPYFIVTSLPPGLTGLLIAAVFAAAMSTVSTSLNSSATLILTDVYQRYINRSPTEKQSMRVLYVATVVWGAIGTLLGLAVIGQESALDAWWILSGIFSGGMIGLFLTGRVAKKADNPAAVTAICIGTLVILWMTLPKAFEECESFLGPMPSFLEAIKSPFDPLLIPVFGTATIVLVGFLIGVLRHRGEPR